MPEGTAIHSEPIPWYAFPVECSGPLLMLGLAIFAGQIFLSHWWLRRFQFGPVEWLWRAATRGEWPPWKANF